MLVIAHRGYSSEFPENTLLAFEEAIRAGADGFECDLRLTSDGEVVVFHDDDLKRLCGVDGTVERSLWSDLKNLKVKGQEPIPRFEELLSGFHSSRMNLEIKPSHRPEVVVEQIIRVLGKNRPSGSILFSSFDPTILDALHSMDSRRKLGGLGVLVETPAIGDLPKSLTRWEPQTWNVPRQILDKPWKKRWEGMHIPPLWIWTLDEPHHWTQVQKSSLPFEAIITNKPAALRNFLNRQHG